MPCSYRRREFLAQLQMFIPVFAGGFLLLARWSSWVSPHAVFPFHRARSSVTAQGLPGGDVWPDRHQLSDFRGLEGSAHGGHDMNMWFWELRFQRN